MAAVGRDGKSRVRRSIEIETEDTATERDGQSAETPQGVPADAGQAKDAPDAGEDAAAAEPVIEDAEVIDPADEIDEVAMLTAQLLDARDKHARLQAEWDNFRKRTAAERAEERSRATERLVTNLLQVVDDMERAIDNAPGGEDDPMLEGIKAIYNKFVDMLGREGLTAIDPQDGDPFDIHLHQAVGKLDDPSVPDETVRQAYQKGYRMGEKLLRPAMVVVTTGGPKREAVEVGSTEEG